MSNLKLDTLRFENKKIVPTSFIEEIDSSLLSVKYTDQKYWVIFPKANDLDVKRFECAKYARKIANLEGFFLNRGNAWDLPNINYSEDYDVSKLEKGNLVLFYSLLVDLIKKGE